MTGHARGERSPHAKLTAGEVREIFRRYKDEDITMKSLGREYGISGASVSNIVNGLSWKSLGLINSKG